MVETMVGIPIGIPIGIPTEISVETLVSTVRTTLYSSNLVVTVFHQILDFASDVSTSMSQKIQRISLPRTMALGA
jgi:hypothetical protein